jgi:ABC-type transporter Mla MlaB component
MKTFSDDGVCFVDMEYSFTTNEVEQFKMELSALLKTDKEFMIHCIDLKEIDSAGLQLLISLKKYLHKENITFEISAGTKFKELITFFELEEYFKGDII